MPSGLFSAIIDYTIDINFYIIIFTLMFIISWKYAKNLLFMYNLRHFSQDKDKKLAAKEDFKEA